MQSRWSTPMKVSDHQHRPVHLLYFLLQPSIHSPAGLGFEDCSAKVVNITDGQFAASHTFAAEHEEIAAKAWNFYAFNVSQEDYQVVINVAGESDSADECATP